MNPELKKQYQWLQVLVYYLQLEPEEWPFEELIGYQQAKKTVVDFATEILGLEIDLENPDYSLITDKIAELLVEPPKIPAPNIPVNLAELVRIYDEYLAKKRETTEKKLFPKLDSETKAHFDRYKQLIQKYVVEGEETLAQNPVLAEAVAHQITAKSITQLPQIARKEALSEAECRKLFLDKILPIISQELKRAGVDESRIAKTPTIISNIVKEAIQEVQSLAASPHQMASLEEVLAAPKPPPLPEIPSPKPSFPKEFPELTDLSSLGWQSSGVKTALPWRFKAVIKRTALAPIAKPLQWLIQMAPEEFREAHPGLVYAAAGFTPKAVRQTLASLHEKSPESREIPFWQGLEAIFKREKTPFLGLLEAYYEGKQSGKFALRFPEIPKSFFAKIISFGKVKTIPEIKMAFWRFLKKTGIGRLLAQMSEKTLLGLMRPAKLSPLATGGRSLLESFKGIIGLISPGIKRQVRIVQIESPTAISVFPRNILTKLSGFTLSLFSGLTKGPSSDKLIQLSVLAVFIPVIILISLTFLIILIILSAFLTPEERFPSTENQYLAITKSASPSQISTEAVLPTIVDYQIEITPKQSPLSEIGIEEEIRVIPHQSPPEIRLLQPEVLPTTINSSITLNYQIYVFPEFDDSYIINTFRITFTAPDGVTDTLEVSYPLIVGASPASDCPLPPESYQPSCRSYVNPTNPCHGTNAYWENLGCNLDYSNRSDCCFLNIPVNFGTGESRAPTSPIDPGDGNTNVCYELYPEARQSFYGFAVDASAPPGTPVALPSINGQCFRWAKFASGDEETGRNWSVFRVVGSCNDEPLPFISYELNLVHITELLRSCSETQPCNSGTPISSLYRFDDGTAHLHIEVRIDGEFIPPDNVCQ